MFFKPEYEEITEKIKVCFTKNTCIEIGNTNVSEYIKDLFSERVKKIRYNSSSDSICCCKIIFKFGIPENLAKKCKATGNGEEYALVLGEKTYIYANSDKGFLYGFHNLMSLISDNKNYACTVYDYPVCSVRGYRVYLPGRENFSNFKKTIDFISEYRYNAIIIEIGGAMEYKRHPEINTRWIEFCKEVYSDPERADEIQHKMYPWEKDSIHCENGDGEVLTQDECRTLAEYCKSRGLEVIPEVPTMSHSDYICMAHPEISERADDKYPDAYCPNHPDTYKYVFDIIDEVVEVFNPKQIHIGHDELYSIGCCDRCKGTPPEVLYTDDIKKIKEYLYSKNIKTSMWGEKLLKAFTKAGTPCGGNVRGGFKNGGQWFSPPLWKCRDLMPDGIMFMNWFWDYGKSHDKVFHDRKYEMAFGNLSVIFADDWRERIKQGAKGAWVSNWGSFDEEYMQRNIQYFDLISGAYALWNSDYSEKNQKSLLKKTMREAYKYKWRDAEDIIRIKHRTDKNIEHEYFWCGVFIKDEKYLIGKYEVSYSDGTKFYLPVKYGTNIGSKYMRNYPLDRELMQLTGAVLPCGKNGDFFYECKYVNPSPCCDIVSIKYISVNNEYNVEYEVL